MFANVIRRRTGARCNYLIVFQDKCHASTDPTLSLQVIASDKDASVSLPCLCPAAIWRVIPLSCVSKAYPFS